jgi:hypothetical protein
MNNYKKIFEYIQDEMSSEERMQFEAQLKEDSFLAGDYKNYLNLQKKLSSLKNPQVNENYFEESFLKFRNREVKSRPLLNPKFAFSFASIGIVLIILLISFSTKDIENNSYTLNDEELLLKLENDITFSFDSYNALFENIADSLLIEELNLEDIAFSDNWNYGYFDLSEEEAEFIYESLTDKKFF